MIDFVQGKLAEKSEDGAIIDVGGVGLFLCVSTSTLQGLPKLGEKARLQSYLHVKEDLLQLYGFSDKREREIFLKLIGVSGIGPKAAMAVLSAYDPENFIRIIATEDLDAITAVSGVGKKSGQRILLELKDKLAPLAGDLSKIGARGDGGDMYRQAREALKGLGYGATEINLALDDYASEEPRLEDMIRFGLKHLGGA
ncbi:MAG: Holliday junction DNA helicase RuvA [Candidatus Solincola sediminis]|uniref:Holliday junction branch migration complex subunit RuvA n=1 Tax=Candidatus Solincola sediminis TaxID=1797199 RepID=A0A1F2WFU5_9ACTN|nr:MAG: Holliday junction DNA helicase RuvA [Candidatus Solincola sediminis]OFW58106.1 MAG: Holliday junction DNA helicase RuvA [Candidatus Solincola sediminis]